MDASDDDIEVLVDDKTSRRKWKEVIGAPGVPGCNKYADAASAASGLGLLFVQLPAWVRPADGEP